ncbi:Sec-independent protein translocase subunit TatA/TatB [Melioribacter sp. OK-6-Me]|uniref:Sec-independent protein translocase subunit TatA/TatB n=1 Tax=unclassified Melioribacter TaxID=2627329 RepID=UPI003ED9C69F
MFGNLGASEIILIVLAILILFGAKKIPEVAQGIGKGMREFKKAMREVEEDIKSIDKIDTKKETEKGKSETSN